VKSGGGRRARYPRIDAARSWKTKATRCAWPRTAPAARAALDDKMPDWCCWISGCRMSMASPCSRNGKQQGRLTMPVVMMSGHGTIHTAVEATRLGAFDYLEKPMPYKQLLETVEKALETRSGRGQPPPAISRALGDSESHQTSDAAPESGRGAGLPIALMTHPGAGEQIAAHYHDAARRALRERRCACATRQPSHRVAGARQRRSGLRAGHLGALSNMQQKWTGIAGRRVAPNSAYARCRRQRSTADATTRRRRPDPGIARPFCARGG
jgi:CheY-like chemotaxis protein